MKTFNKLILFLPVLCLLLMACRTSRQVVKTTDSDRKEVIENKTVYRDTIIYTDKASTTFNLPISDLKKCAETDFKNSLNAISEPKIYTQKNGNAKATIKILHDTLTVTAECDSIAIAAKIKREYFNRYLNDVKRNDEYVNKETELNWQLIISLIIIAFIAGFVTNSLLKI